MKVRSERPKLAFAADLPCWDEAKDVCAAVAPEVDVIKIGLELFVAEGPTVVRAAADLGCEVFLDLKLHDIPKTVERSVAQARHHGAHYLTVHAAGGAAMLSAAVQGTRGELTIVAVTVLTSLSDDDLTAIGVLDPSSRQAERLARLAVQQGAGGLVCSVLEASTLRRAVGEEPLLVTPGIRLPTGTSGDQKRIGTPKDAVRAGSDMLVVGRPIRDADDPARAAQSIRQMLCA